jgi:hypothetical protein
MNKLFSWLTGSVLNSVTGVIDDLFTSDEERIKAKALVQQAIMEQALKSDQMRADIIQTEAKGNWLQRSWRPILMLSFGFVVLYSKFIAPAFSLPNTELEPDFWNLLQLGIGGYVIGRSAEKIAKDVTHKIQYNKNKKQ